MHYLFTIIAVFTQFIAGYYCLEAVRDNQQIWELAYASFAIVSLSLLLLIPKPATLLPPKKTCTE